MTTRFSRFMTLWAQILGACALTVGAVAGVVWVGKNLPWPVSVGGTVVAFTGLMAWGILEDREKKDEGQG